MSVQVVEEKKKKDVGIPTWMIAGGIAAVFALFTGIAVYQIKKSRKQQLRDARYGEDYPESYSTSKITKYWSLTKKTFQAVSKVVGDFLSPKDKQLSPFVDSVTANARDAIHSDAEL